MVRRVKGEEGVGPVPIRRGNEFVLLGIPVLVAVTLKRRDQGSRLVPARLGLHGKVKVGVDVPEPVLLVVVQKLASLGRSLLLNEPHTVGVDLSDVKEGLHEGVPCDLANPSLYSVVNGLAALSACVEVCLPSVGDGGRQTKVGLRLGVHKKDYVVTPDVSLILGGCMVKNDKFPGSLLKGAVHLLQLLIGSLNSLLGAMKKLVVPLRNLEVNVGGVPDDIAFLVNLEAGHHS
mmetsp:Transcript_9305/g.18868  ORF Transcript_9305/g.18868 Transcript_9305/m.18868 type:complete len:233 (-) Transcript_9305:609-1307(-)